MSVEAILMTDGSLHVTLTGADSALVTSGAFSANLEPSEYLCRIIENAAKRELSDQQTPHRKRDRRSKQT